MIPVHKSKTILFFGAHQWERETAISTALRMGLRIVMVADESSSDLLRLADKVLLCNPYNVDETVDIVSKYADNNQIDAVVGLNDHVLPAYSAVCKRLGLKGFPMGPVNYADNKYLFRKLMRENRIAHPAFSLILPGDELKGAAEKITFPAILKPLDHGGSLGIYHIDDKSALKKAWEMSAQDVEEWNFLIRERGKFILESCIERKTSEWLPSGELSVECVSFDGRHYPVVFVDKRLVSPKRPVEIGHIVPGAFPKDVCVRIGALVGSVLSAAGVDWGVTHNEIIIGTEEDVPVEFHMRPAGDRIIDLIFHALGINLYEVLIRMALGERFDEEWIKPKRNKVVEIRYFDLGPGKIDDLKPLHQLSFNPDIVEIKFTKKSGDNVGRIEKNYYDRYGYTICVGNSISSVMKLSESVHKAAKAMTCNG